LAFSLFLSYLVGERGDGLFNSFWSSLLDNPNMSFVTRLFRLRNRVSWNIAMLEILPISAFAIL